jgi:3-keto-5-aminohexanoate cleavage enzyme
MDKLIITVSPAGRANIPDPPDMSDPETQAQAVTDAHNAGASVAHLHGALLPSADGERQPDLEHWGAVTRLVRERSDIVVQYGVAVMKPKGRKSLLTLGPEMGSFLIGHHDILSQHGPLSSISTLDEQRESAQYHQEAGVLAETEVWHQGNYWNFNQLIDTGHLVAPHFATLFFGWPGGNWTPTTPQELQSRIEGLPEGTQWTVSAKGPDQINMHAMAIMLGGHVRLGFQDNPDLHPGVPAKSNAELVERIVRLARDMGREVATPSDVRAMLNLPRRPL